MNPPNSLSPESQTKFPLPKINWLIFFIVLFTPALLSMIGFAANAATAGYFAGVCTFFGSPLAAIVCSVLVARAMTGSIVQRVIAAVGLAIGLTSVLYFVTVFVGCAIRNNLR